MTAPRPAPGGVATASATPASLAVDGITLGYQQHSVINGLTMLVPQGELTVIVGPNGCGKSTLLRGLARLLKPSAGTVLLDGTDIHSQRSAEVARRLGLLPQSPVTPEGIGVTDLVSRGRYAHQGFLRRWGDADEEAVADAMRLTAIEHLADRDVDTLSGGQRQRVWLATVLAQNTPIVLLDEPTTFLDIGHQMEVMELCTELRRQGRTVVAVLHDLTQAARFASHVVMLHQGGVRAAGVPRDVLTPEALEEVFGWPCRVIDDPEGEGLLIVPRRSATNPTHRESP